ncbi:hypothetical protein PENPOL_c022G02674 [Penicillium polonicum]|uniref:Uncharacterized protein n=1 Tax=Penicillium polonicum TaxID=60169 RepID=A0A1V6N7K8_PENPO|nr:hypothetical protein PENPOL_c022G02674 [Penicillium polonicum]
MTDQKLGAFALVLDSQGDNQSPTSDNFAGPP